MSLVEQRHAQRLRLLIGVPALAVAALASLTLLLMASPGLPTREAMFDLIMRLEPRPEADLPVATILIDEESSARVGPWPWPRSALAELVDAAEQAGALSVTLAVAVNGEDPLSPDVLAERWAAVPSTASQGAIDALEALPSNNLLLARAVAGGATSISVAGQVHGTSMAPRWAETTPQVAPWLAAIAGEGAPERFSLPDTPTQAPLAPELGEARVLAVSGFPDDPGQIIRRAGVLYMVNGEPAASAPLASVLASRGEKVSVTFRKNFLSFSGFMPKSVRVGEAPPITLDRRAEYRLWLPQDISTENVSAWRVLTDRATWTGRLAGQHVFIGESLSPLGTVRTPRGRMPTAQLHALTAGQLSLGAAPVRVLWAGFVEAGTSILVGLAAILAVVYLPPLLAATAAIVLAVLSFVSCLTVFSAFGALFDPFPSMAASFVGPIAVGLTVFGNMAIKGDRVRGAFHGALPQNAVQRIQNTGGQRVLSGTYRDVTVLSCALKLPLGLLRRFEADPEAFMEFKGSANDRLRRTILDHQGTVDYGEDGRLLGYWNVPLDEPKHIELACACALKMLDDVSAMSEAASDSAALPRGTGDDDGDLSDCRLEVGVATGPCFAGPAGLGGTNRYAAIGPAVSFASRLRSRSELYGPAILTDAAVHEALQKNYAFLDLDFVRRTANDQPEMIYGLVGNPFLKASKTFSSLADTQRQLLDSWRTQDLATATVQLQKLRGMPGVPQPYAELFDRRIMDARAAKARRTTDIAEIMGS